MYILPPGTLKLSLWPVLCIHQQPWKNPITHTFIYIYIQYIYTWYLGTLETVEYCYKQLKRFNSVFYQKRINKQNKQLIGVRFLSFYMVNHLQMHISKCISTYYITKKYEKKLPDSHFKRCFRWKVAAVALLPRCPVAPWHRGAPCCAAATLHAPALQWAEPGKGARGTRPLARGARGAVGHNQNASDGDRTTIWPPSDDFGV